MNEKEVHSDNHVAEKRLEKDNDVAARRLEKELAENLKNPPTGCSVALKGDSLFEWQCVIEGPPDSPFEGGKFTLRFVFPKDYPFKQPRVTFLTKVYHCNVDSKGKICVDVLDTKWVSGYKVATLLLSIRTFLTDCDPHRPLVPEIAQQFLKNREKHD